MIQIETNTACKAEEMHQTKLQRDTQAQNAQLLRRQYSVYYIHIHVQDLTSTSADVTSWGWYTQWQCTNIPICPSPSIQGSPLTLHTPHPGQLVSHTHNHANQLSAGLSFRGAENRAPKAPPSFSSSFSTSLYPTLSQSYYSACS